MMNSPQTQNETTPNGADERPLILVIDDDQRMARALSLLLDDWGFAYVTAESPTAAVRSLGPRLKEVRAVITDYHLQDGFTGIKGAAAIVKAIGRPVPTLVTTCFLDLADNLSAFPVLAKPFDPNLLRQWLTYQLENDHSFDHPASGSPPPF
jgi:DNA-binding NtrC family response regulator